MAGPILVGLAGTEPPPIGKQGQLARRTVGSQPGEVADGQVVPVLADLARAVGASMGIQSSAAADEVDSSTAG